MVSRWWGTSPNHTMPGRARSPHLVQCGRSASATTGSTMPSESSTSSSVPPSAAQIGELGAGSRWPHRSEEQSTSKSLPCISSNCGCGWDWDCGADVDSSTEGEILISSSRARALRPSTFCVISVKVASGAVRLRMDSIENLARATCAALGLAAKALRDVVPSVLRVGVNERRHRQCR